MIVACALALLITGLDLFSLHFNLSILYVIPLVVVAKMNSRRALVEMMIALITLTIAVYVFKALQLKHPVFTTRMFNRVMVVVSLATVTCIFCSWVGVSQQMIQASHLRGASDAQSEVFEKITQILRNLVAVLICGTLLICIFVTDLVTPGQYNLPIMYGVPLVAAAWLRSRKALWGIVPLLLLCNFFGWKLGEAPVLDSTRTVATLIANRCISGAVVVLMALVLDLYFGIARDRQMEMDSSNMALTHN